MEANVVRRTPAWRVFVWAGVATSVVGWAWVWFQTGGVAAVMFFVALATVVLAYRGTAGMRLAVVGLMVAGLALFLASLYWLTMMFMGTNVTARDVLVLAVVPLVGSILLLVGAGTGYRHVNETETA